MNGHAPTADRIQIVDDEKRFTYVGCEISALKLLG